MSNWWNTGDVGIRIRGSLNYIDELPKKPIVGDGYGVRYHREIDVDGNIIKVPYMRLLVWNGISWELG